MPGVGIFAVLANPDVATNCVGNSTVTSAATRRLLTRIALPNQAERLRANVVAHVAWWAVVSSTAIPVVLTTGWLVGDAVQPPSYSPMRQTVSVLSGDAATDRWIVTVALYTAAALYFVTAAGMSGITAAMRIGLLVAGAAAIGVASFPEPAHGSSREHGVCTVIGALALTVWPALAARHPHVVAAVGRRVSFSAVVVSAGLLAWTAYEAHHGHLLGLAERVSSGLQVTWPGVVAVALRRAWSNDRDDPVRRARTSPDERSTRGSPRRTAMPVARRRSGDRRSR
jgi:hypothetical protein